MSRLVRLIVTTALVAPLTVAVVATSSSATTKATCAALTKSELVSLGFSGATGPVVTPYNYTNAAKNAANSLGTTYDFGAKAIVVGCVSPSDIVKLSKQAGSTMSAQQYMNYMVKQSAGAMNKTLVAGTNDYLDFGNGKEDGLGSTDKMGSVRLDAWVAGGYIFLGFSGPVTSPKASSAVQSLIRWTEANF
jgi:hypothetical protein